MKKGLKMICFVLAIVLVLSVASTAFAFTVTYDSNRLGWVIGGPSQMIASGIRTTTQPTWDLQSAYSDGTNPGTWKMRGYSGGATITNLVPINRGGVVYYFTYTSMPSYVSMYESVDSTSQGAYYYYTGTLNM